MLGWLGDPLVDRLQRRGWSRQIGGGHRVLRDDLLVLVALVLLVPMIERQIVTLVESLPTYRDWFIGTVLPWFERRTGLDLLAWLDPERIVPARARTLGERRRHRVDDARLPVELRLRADRAGSRTSC